MSLLAMMNASASVAFCQLSTTDLSSVVGMKSYPVPCTTFFYCYSIKKRMRMEKDLPQARRAGTAWGSGCQAGLAVSPQDPLPQSKSNHLKNKSGAIFLSGCYPATLPYKTMFDEHCKEPKYRKLKQISPAKELRGHSPNFHIHVSVSNLYIPTMDLLILLQEKCGPILGRNK
jgi:hypothetical protein